MAVRVSETPFDSQQPQPGFAEVFEGADVLFSHLGAGLKDKEAAKATIKGALSHLRGEINAACECLPASKSEQLQVARSFVDNVAAAAESDTMPQDPHGSNEDPYSAGALVFDADDADAPEAVVSGRAPTLKDFACVERRFGTPVGELSDADFARALGVFREVLLDLQAQLLDLTEGDVDDLAEACFLVARLTLGYAKLANGVAAAHFGVNLQACAEARRQAELAAAESTAAAAAGLAPVAGEGSVAGEVRTEEGKRRILWAPLGPQLWKKAQELAAVGQQRPAAAIAVVACCLPLTWLALFIAPPLLVGDAVVQWGVTTPPGAAAARCAVGSVQAARLWYLVAKLSTKQSFRFARREFRRVGGIGGVACCAAGAAVAVATDPVGTARTAYGFMAAAGLAVVEHVVWLRGWVAAATAAEGMEAL